MSKTETQELSQVKSFLSSEIINPKETDQSICFAFPPDDVEHYH